MEEKRKRSQNGKEVEKREKKKKVNSGWERNTGGRIERTERFRHRDRGREAGVKWHKK